MKSDCEFNISICFKKLPVHFLKIGCQYSIIVFLEKNEEFYFPRFILCFPQYYK